MSKWYPCVYCTEDLKCTKNSGDGVISFCVLGPCHDETPSNADRIRAKNDEELAEWIETIVYCALCQLKGKGCKGGRVESRASCRNHWLYWLRQEATQ